MASRRRARLVSQIISDPGLPRDDPSAAYWQLPPHPTLENARSSELSSEVDFAIIGSGITGSALAKGILEHPLAGECSVVVFEARTLTSGASGRNWGGLASFLPYEFAEFCEQHGQEKAVEIAKFTYQTIEKMYALALSSPALRQRSEIRRTRDVFGFVDVETRDSIAKSFKLLESLVPESNLKVRFFDGKDALEKFNIKGVVGCMTFNCGAFWPYRLVTGVWEGLMQTYPSRLAIETNTPVTGIIHDPQGHAGGHPYLLSTPRGLVRARRIIHATNGYAGHLLPNLRGKIYPWRGVTTAQDPGPSFGKHHALGRAWTFGQRSKLDPDTGILSGGMHYMNQSPRSGEVFLGLDRIHVEDIFTGDDARVPQASVDAAAGAIPRFFSLPQPEGRGPQMRAAWSGIMGFTADSLPLVGELPASATGRGSHEKGGEWICAGFNGAGVCQCWSSAEAVVKMIFGESVEGLLPKAYLVTEERLNDEKSMSHESVVQRILDDQR